MVTIRKVPSEIRKFFYDNIFRLKYESYELANNGDGVSIILSRTDDYEPAFIVEKDGETLTAVYIARERGAVPEGEIEETALSLYMKHLGKEIAFALAAAGDSCVDKLVCQEDDAEDKREADKEAAEHDEVVEREDALRMAWRDFLAVVLEDENIPFDKDYDEIVDELLDDTLQTIASAEFSVRRPMYITGPDGVEKLVEYPFELE